MAITIRPETNEQKLIDKLCKITEKPISKSLLIAAESYVNERTNHLAMLEKLRQEKFELQEQLEEIKEVLQDRAEIESKINNFLNPVKAKKGRS